MCHLADDQPRHKRRSWDDAPGGLNDLETTESRRFIFRRQYGQTYPLIVRAEGIRLMMSTPEYIDGSSGAIAVVSVGHGRRRDRRRTIARQAERMPMSTRPSSESARRELAAAWPA